MNKKSITPAVEGEKDRTTENPVDNASNSQRVHEEKEHVATRYKLAMHGAKKIGDFQVLSDEHLLLAIDGSTPLIQSEFRAIANSPLTLTRVGELHDLLKKYSTTKAVLEHIQKEKIEAAASGKRPSFNNGNSATKQTYKPSEATIAQWVLRRQLTEEQRECIQGNGGVTFSLKELEGVVNDERRALSIPKSERSNSDILDIQASRLLRNNIVQDIFPTEAAALVQEFTRVGFSGLEILQLLEHGLLLTKECRSIWEIGIAVQAALTQLEETI